MSAQAALVAGVAGAPEVHDLDRQLACGAKHLVRDGGPVEQAGEARAAARPDHQLAGTGLMRRPDQAGGRVTGPDQPQGPAQLTKQAAVLLQLRLRRRVKVVERRDVHRLEPGGGEPGELSRVADEPLVGG
ncbi:MAG TPA: hypothetical protein VIZ43_25335 [Trebonia sp.]